MHRKRPARTPDAMCMALGVAHCLPAAERYVLRNSISNCP